METNKRMALSLFNLLHVGFTGPSACAGTNPDRLSRRSCTHVSSGRRGHFSAGMRANRRFPAAGALAVDGGLAAGWCYRKKR